MVITAPGRWRQEDQEFKVILNYKKRLRPVRAMGHPGLERKGKKEGRRKKRNLKNGS